MHVYTLRPGTLSNVRFKIVDGDMRKVFPAGFEFHPVTNSARQADGTRIHKTSLYQGVPVHPEHLPTRIERGGAKPLRIDIAVMHNLLFVSEKFRQVVEGLEPGKHQFTPVEIVFGGGVRSAQFHWFHPCARIDGIDRERTTHHLSDVGLWQHVPGGEYVINLGQVSGSHVWIDPRLNTHGHPFVSEAFKQAMDEAGVDNLA